MQNGADAGLIELPEPRVYRSMTVIMPVYNERTTVAEVIRRMRAVELPVTLQITAVDDGSSDGSDKVLGALEDSTVRVLRHQKNQGKGAAVRTGLAEAKGAGLDHTEVAAFDVSDPFRPQEVAIGSRRFVLAPGRFGVIPYALVKIGEAPCVLVDPFERVMLRAGHRHHQRLLVGS